MILWFFGGVSKTPRQDNDCNGVDDEGTGAKLPG